MKKALMKDSVKEIKNTYKRFLSILLMAFLGVGFFAGIKTTSPDMVDTINEFYKQQNVYDVQILSTMGLTNMDIDEINKIEGVENTKGTYEIDGKIDIDNKEIIVKSLCVDDINVPNLIDGKLPENKNECVVEKSFLEYNNKKIGDKIYLEIENTTNDEGDELEYLKEKTLTIVGVAKSPLYISRDRGTSTLGSGKINYYIYLSKDNINASDIYTTIYLKIKNENSYKTSSKEYEELVENIKNKIEGIKEERQNFRHNQIVNVANQKVVDAENELNTEKQDAQNKINDAQIQIDDGKKKIEQVEIELNNQEQKAKKEFANAEKAIKSAKEEIANNEQELAKKEQEANIQFSELEKQKVNLQNQLNNINSGLETLNLNYEQVKQALQNSNLSDVEKQNLEQTKVGLEQQIEGLNQNKAKVEVGISQIEKGITDGKNELESVKNQIESAKQEINKQEKQLVSTKATTNSKIQNAKKELANSKIEIQNAEGELNSQKVEFEEKVKEAEGKLIDAKKDIDDIENPKWYILDRYGNAGYNSFVQDTQSIANISQVFPVVFFVVAILISLTSMTRMVEEQRGEIGTLKALGYNKMQIASKYLIYAALASIIGGILGMCVGFVLIPKVIWMMYSMMYEMGEIQLGFNIYYGGMGLILISVCIVGATLYSAMKELIHMPAILLRPKAPKIGKRVLLERIPFIWKHLTFTRKVTVRNIFRYKKRFLMTIIGILGCTSLILAGFGLKNSISAILPDQFEKIFNYDMQINLKNGLSEEQKNTYIKNLQEKEGIEKIAETYMNSTTAVNGENEEDVQIIIPNDEENIKGLINILDVKTGEYVQLKENEIALTDKAAQLLNVKVGDMLTLRDNDEKEFKVKISNIAENYISHYIFMTKTTYEKVFEKEYETNVVLTKNSQSVEEQEELATQIMSDKEVGTISKTSTIMDSFNNMIKSLNYVVIVLIVSAGLLAFVVLYNLSNVNISERIRELATIKVLGFYDKEVYNYVTRETVILTIIGILLGLIGGYFLNYFIMSTCEINMLRFTKVIQPISYLYAILITIGFSFIVNIATYFSLKKINMIESLKSVE